MASTYINRTPSSAGNQRTFTISCWVKLSSVTQQHYIFSYGTEGVAGDPRGYVGFQNTGLAVIGFNPTGSTWYEYTSTAVFRDVNGWYHFVWSVDTTQATSSDRLKLYVNGVEYSLSGAPAQNFDTGFNTTKMHEIGSYPAGRSNGYLNGLLAHYNYVDGTAYAASTFGETDSTSGVWKPKTAPSVTYGTNGFFLKFANSASLGTDSSGNGNNFSTYGSGTQTLDTPSNVYPTLNYLKQLTGTLSNGNLTWLASGDNGVWSTIGMNKGKWYWETQVNADPVMMGIASENVQQTTGRADQAGVYGVQNGTTYAYYRNNGTSGQSTGFPQVGAGSSVINHALDLDNGKYFVGVDGVYKDLSGTASDAAAGTNPTFSSLDTNLFWFPFAECRGNGAGCDINFGNGYFGTTVISSPNNDGAGEGKFAYTPPTGYYALNTKNIKTYG